MNPAALKVHQKEVAPGGTIICNANAFTLKNLKFAGYETNPLEDKTLDDYFTLYSVEMGKMVSLANEDLEISSKIIDRTKNFFALGLLFWIYDRPLESTKKWLGVKFAKKPEIVEANIRALDAGYNYGETTEIFTTRYKVDKADLPAGTYRNVVGNYALSMGLAAAAEKSKLGLFYGGYPITPASDILHTLSAWKHLGIKTFQAEDEIAGITSVLGAAFTGDLGITATSGPGIALKGEAMGLAVMAELPIVIINVQRGGPSTGLPTKTEQSDLMQAMYGRNGEAPVPVLASATPGDCFFAAYEACRIAVKYMTPVVLLTDGYLANGSEPWQVPKVDDLPDFDVSFADESNLADGQFLSYSRDKKTLARPWAIPGTPGLEHRIGGIETEDLTGNVSYDPDNHHYMVETRAKKIDAITNEIASSEIFGSKSGDLLILSWGGTKGACRSATEALKADGKKVGHLHLRWINPFPKDLGEKLIKFKNILIPEINYGQLIKLIRAEFLVDAQGLNQVRGKPISSADIQEASNKLIG